MVKISPFIRSSSGRNRINVLEVVNAITKEVTSIQNTTCINAYTIVEFFTLHRSGIPLEKMKRIVYDNARYQHCKYVIETAKELNIELLFLPAYSPSLNIIEMLWKFTKKEVLYAKYYANSDKSHLAITSFVNNIKQNNSPKLNSLLNLKFQLFDNVKIYPVLKYNSLQPIHFPQIVFIAAVQNRETTEGSWV